MVLYNTFCHDSYKQWVLCDCSEFVCNREQRYTKVIDCYYQYHRFRLENLVSRLNGQNILNEKLSTTDSLINSKPRASLSLSCTDLCTMEEMVTNVCFQLLERTTTCFYQSLAFLITSAWFGKWYESWS